MDEKARNQMTALMKRISEIFSMVGGMINICPDESAEKLFVTFFLTKLAQERGLLDDNCNRAVAKALYTIGLEEEETPSYLQKKEA